MAFNLWQEMLELEAKVLAGTALAGTTEGIGSPTDGGTDGGSGGSSGDGGETAQSRTITIDEEVIVDGRDYEIYIIDGKRYAVDAVDPNGQPVFTLDRGADGGYVGTPDKTFHNRYRIFPGGADGGTGDGGADGGSIDGGTTVQKTNVIFRTGDTAYSAEVTVGTTGDDILNEAGFVYGGMGNDSITGKTSKDIIDGGIGSDWLAGLGGDDVVEGGDGNDIVGGQDGNDIVSGGAGDDEVWGGSGDDEADGGAGNDAIRGEDGDDTLSGGSGNDWIAGQAGNDTVDGGDGHDVVGGQEGSDIVQGGAGDDQGWGGTGNDWLYGGSGNDWLAGQEDNDYVDGGTGNDIVGGQDGNDTLLGGAGNDELWGGAGADRFLFNTALSATGNVDQIKDFSAAEGDKILLEHDIFTMLPMGFVSSYLFTVGAAAATAEQRIVYHQETGALFYDADGSGAQAAVQFATLTAGTYLTAYQFTVV